MAGANGGGNVGTPCAYANKDTPYCYTGTCRQTSTDDGSPGRPGCF